MIQKISILFKYHHYHNVNSGFDKIIFSAEQRSPYLSWPYFHQKEGFLSDCVNTLAISVFGHQTIDYYAQ